MWVGRGAEVGGAAGRRSLLEWYLEVNCGSVDCGLLWTDVCLLLWGASRDVLASVGECGSAATSLGLVEHEHALKPLSDYA